LPVEAENVETGLASGKIDAHICGIENLIAETHGKVEFRAIRATNNEVMNSHVAIVCIRLALATIVVSTMQALNGWSIYKGFYSGNWFLALYFPLILAMTIFGITIYFLTKGILWRRLLITLLGGLILTAVWLFVFMMAAILITGVGGELVTVKSP
jgi:hypothetical protein